jgi:hypothetical protein
MQQRRRSSDPTTSHLLIVEAEEPVIGIPYEDAEGNELWRYFSNEEDAETFARSVRGNDPPSMAGVWSDLDWDEMEDALDRIRHDSVPTPPIDDL